MPVVQYEVLRALSFDFLSAAGLPEDEAQIVGDHLVMSNLVGHDSHGIRRLLVYARQGQREYIRWGDRVVDKDAPAFAIIDGKGSNGIVAVTQLTDLAVEKARYSGFGFVGLRNVSHIGRLGDYPPRIAAQGMVGMVWMNGGGGFMAPFGSADRRLRPEPMAFGVPRRDGPPFMLDICMSVVAGGKIEQKKDRQEPIPDGWLINHDGDYVNEGELYGGKEEFAVLPLGGLQFGHKGYGLAMMVEMIVGPLTRAGCSKDGPGGDGIMILAIDIAQFNDLDTHYREVEALVDWVHSARPLPGVKKIYAPGEIEEETRQQRLAEGIEVPEQTWQNLTTAAAELGVSMPAA